MSTSRLRRLIEPVGNHRHIVSERSESHSMELTNLHYFQIAVDEQNISKAADKLYISRQALSKTIKRLEEQLGTQLIVPSAHGIQLTENGTLLYETTSKILSSWNSMLQQFAVSHAKAYKIHVGYGHNSYNLWTRDHAERFTAQYPQIEINVQSMLPDQLLKALENHQLDLVISNARPRSDAFLCMPLLSRPSYALVHEQDPLARLEQITPQHLNMRSVCFIPFDQTGQNNFSQLMDGYNLSYHPVVCPAPTLTTICNEMIFYNAVFITSAIFWETSHQQGFVLKPFETGIPRSFYNLDVNTIVRRSDAQRQDILSYVNYLKLSIKPGFKYPKDRSL